MDEFWRRRGRRAAFRRDFATPTADAAKSSHFHQPSDPLAADVDPLAGEVLKQPWRAGDTTLEAMQMH